MTRAAARWTALALAFVAAGITLWFLYRGEGDPLTEKKLAEARTLWKSAGLTEYDIEIEVSGGQQATHVLSVRGGKVTTMTTNGVAAPERIWAVWTVEGMFDTLETELRNAAAPKVPYGVDDPADVVLQVAFDDKLGLPRRFFRHVLGSDRGGIEWDITRFEPNPTQ